MRTNEIRKLFLEYFKSKGHVIKQSDSLIPADPTLLFTSAGMVQFKPLWVAKGKIEFTKAATCQKCLRTPDLERVGITARHHTFFEMLGNFSFGDYFKKEAVGYAWDFVTNVLKLDKSALWVSVYEEDSEAYGIWNTHIGIKAERIVRLGKKDNFWGPVGGTGPCGPCSEIYIDFGPSYGCGGKDCKPGCDCDRFEEFGNLVFPSFDADERGNFNVLAKRGIDTGMGLERLASIIQNTKNNFDIDIIKPVVLEAADLTGSRYKEDPKKDIQLKVIADHTRAATFLISDGVFPLNEGRGYVLRRIIRRAVRYGKLLGSDNPFLYKLSGGVIDLMKEAYPETAERRVHISQIIQQEEQRFQETLNTGMNLLEELALKYKKTLPGDEAFKLYDTYGFPLELTVEILAEKQMTVDETGFRNALEGQQEKARAAWKGSGEKETSINTGSMQPTVFTGYEELESGARVLGVHLEGNEAEIILDRTPFYAESGGQVGDTGTISGAGLLIEVSDTTKQNKIFIHHGTVKKGSIKTGDTVAAKVDGTRRKALMANHTSTHLLQYALRKVLGEHIAQSGSFVSPERFRFDFTHFKGLTKEELDRVEALMNEKAGEKLCVNMNEMKIDEAKKSGALAFFGDKYGETVRVVSIADISREFCGGTHIDNTGSIGTIKLVSESSVAAGVRRIEGVSGAASGKIEAEESNVLEELKTVFKTDGVKLIESAASLIEKARDLEKDVQSLKRGGKRKAGKSEAYIVKTEKPSGSGPYETAKFRENVLEEIGGLLKVKVSELPSKMKKILESIDRSEAEIKKLESGEGKVSIEELIKDVKEIKGVKALVRDLEGADAGSLRDLGDKIKDKLGSAIIVLFAKNGERVNYICAFSKNLLTKEKNAILAGNEIKTLLSEGKGGGREDFVQGGGKLKSGMDETIAAVYSIIETKLL